MPFPPLAATSRPNIGNMPQIELGIGHNEVSPHKASTAFE
jgi:hypothetical protein